MGESSPPHRPHLHKSNMPPQRREPRCAPALPSVGHLATAPLLFELNCNRSKKKKKKKKKKDKRL
eukprot:NODE_14299_length_233_cov_91.769663.p3 GENE.NODE_14299_length_233_cov_91.769663~~NODE_14299_length_233_cov_91.769663.p3  ORF type:complete len:65 (-),score=29.29 NODE_14299_length_233_cov_91.769663:21-215(-)